MNIRNLNFKIQKRCQCCDLEMEELIDLTNFPITEFYEKYDEDYEGKGFFDQTILFCSHCSHMSLKKILDVKFIYSNYLTSTSSSYGAILCLNNFYNFVLKNTLIQDMETIIDVGGNDSFLLKKFSSSLKKINIDPNAQKMKGIKVFDEMIENFDFNIFKLNNNKVFLCSHTIEHLEKPFELMLKVSKVMSGNDIFFIQIPSLEKIIYQQRFDQLCHQHLNYFSKNSLSIICNKIGLNIQSYEYDESHFGTLRMALKKNHQKKNDVKTGFINKIEIITSYKKFIEYMDDINLKIYSFKEIYGFGAGLMVPVLSYYLESLSNLKCIYDENEFKNEKRFINLNVPIKSLQNKDVIKEQNIIITSISTKMAARMIFKKLVDLKAKNIILPVIFI